MASQSKSNAARINGAKSRGPSTPEGKARSSQNARKHGLTAHFDILACESQPDFDALLESHLTQYQPVGALEMDLVRNLAVARWRIRRIPILESDLFDNEIAVSSHKSVRNIRTSFLPGRLGVAFRNLVDRTQAISILMRYETALTRHHDRVFKHLTAIQKLRNEPKPAIGQALQPTVMPPNRHE